MEDNFNEIIIYVYLIIWVNLSQFLFISLNTVHCKSPAGPIGAFARCYFH